ncbi:MAG: serine--tRNA ligase [Chloroflexota bacterium]
MIDIKLIRENRPVVQEALDKRGDNAPLDAILQLDEKRRQSLFQMENLRAKRNQVSKEIGRTKEKPPQLIAEMKQIGEQITSLEEGIKKLDEEIREHLLRIPNIPASDVPLGKSDKDNPVIRTWGEPQAFPFKPLPHWDIGEKLDIIDFDRGVKLSGTRFYVLKGMGSKLQRSLIQFMLDLHVREHGYTEIYPPYMVKQECLVGSGNLPKFGDNLYHDEIEDFWWVPTAEVPLTNLHRDEIIDGGRLPIYYAAYTACFRREKMAAGKDTRGIKRGHQFDKVELYKFTDAETSDQELLKLLADAEDVVRRLGLAYRIVQLCTGDLGFASTKSFDIELWAPGCNEWLEVSSCSNCRDFQARRANIKYRPGPDQPLKFVHTLNGSGVALPRLFIAVLENYQNADGSIIIPEPLRPYMGTDAIRPS